MGIDEAIEADEGVGEGDAAVEVLRRSVAQRAQVPAQQAGAGVARRGGEAAHARIADHNHCRARLEEPHRPAHRAFFNQA
mgnify:CR=1 FL=1